MNPDLNVPVQNTLKAFAAKDAEIEALKQERDALKTKHLDVVETVRKESKWWMDECDKVSTRMQEIAAERDALRAQLEKADALADVINKTCSLCGEDDCAGCKVDLLLEEHAAYKEARHAKS